VFGVWIPTILFIPHSNCHGAVVQDSTASGCSGVWFFSFFVSVPGGVDVCPTLLCGGVQTAARCQLPDRQSTTVDATSPFHRYSQLTLHNLRLALTSIYIIQACENCREQKIRCNGGRPSCSACAPRRLACVYPTAQRRRGPGKRHVCLLA